MCATVVITRGHCNVVSILVQRKCINIRLIRTHSLQSADNCWCAIRHVHCCLETKVAKRCEHRNRNFKWKKKTVVLFYGILLYSNVIVNSGEGMVVSTVCSVAPADCTDTDSYCQVWKRTLSGLNTVCKITVWHRTCTAKEWHVMNVETELEKKNVMQEYVSLIVCCVPLT
jgi:hypothetical protein